MKQGDDSRIKLWSASALRVSRDQEGRRLLWSPVCVGMGIGVYFVLPAEPSLSFIAAMTLCAALVLLAARNIPMPLVKVVCVGLVLVAVGFMAAKLRVETTGWQTTPMEHAFARLEGRVIAVDPFPNGLRILVDSIQLAGRAPFETPGKVRLRLRGQQPDLHPGDWVTGTVRLLPPSRPLVPDGFDFQRYAYFQELGAIGFSLGPMEKMPHGPDPAWHDVALHLADMRFQTTNRILEKLPSPDGAVAAALLTGQRTAIPEPVMEDVRNAGLAHLLAISGLHVGLVTGLIFFSTRLILALIPRINTRPDTKKIAALAALAGATLYALMAGATVPTLRALLVLCVVLVAVLLDRRGLSLRTLALAALAILLLLPETLIGPSFQMSFAAAFALVVVYESYWQKRQLENTPASRDTTPLVPSWGRVVLRYSAGVSATTVIAGAATWPFMVYHFNVAANFGLLANLIAVPIAALWVMPAGILSLLALPFGLEGPVLWLMAGGISIILDVAAWSAALPAATTALPASAPWVLVLFAFGGLWLGIWRGPVRFVGVLPIGLALAGLGTVQPPDILISEDGRLVAFRMEEGGYALSSLRTARREREELLERAGDVLGRLWQADGLRRGALRCGPRGCTYSRVAPKPVRGLPAIDKNQDRPIPPSEQQITDVALVQDRAGVIADCGRVGLLIALIPARHLCGPDSGQNLVDLTDLGNLGAHAVYLPGIRAQDDAHFQTKGMEINTVEGSRAERPWVVRPNRGPNQTH